MFLVIQVGFASVSTQEFELIKSRYRKGMPERKGSNEVVWNQTIKGINQFKDEPMLMALLAYYPAPGILFERHRLDIKNVFNNDPTFVIKTANKLFNKNIDCLLYKLLPATEQISYIDVRPVLTDTINKLQKENRPDDLKLVNNFKDKADSYYTALKNNTAKLHSASCQQESGLFLKTN
jgi:hypothetical protein